MGWWTNFVSRLRRSPPPDPEIRLRDGGFDVVSPENDLLLASVDWADVDRIETYKLDLMVVDCICVLFKVGDEEVQLSEEWVGFDALFQPLKDNFAGVKDDWYLDVMQPPFEESRTILFSRSEGA